MISIVITSFTDYGNYTSPLIDSILKFEQGHEIIVIDNGSKNAFPPDSDYEIFRFHEPVSWSKMINIGAEIARGDWLLFLNDDTLCKGNFSQKIKTLDKNAVYGPKLKVKPASWAGFEIPYMQAWILVIQKELFKKIGGMDEWYPKSGVDDIDFCWRAGQMSIPLIAADFPFVHLEQFRRTKWQGFDEQMERSKQYFIDKAKGALNGR